MVAPRRVGAFEAKNRLAELLAAAERGEEIVITRRGRPVARLGPVGKVATREAPRRVARRILKRSKGVTLGGVRLRALIDEGRK